MIRTLRAIMRDGGVDLLDPADLPEGTKLLVMVLGDEEQDFWLQAGQAPLESIWGNTEDDIYAQLLEE